MVEDLYIPKNGHLDAQINLQTGMVNLRASYTDVLEDEFEPKVWEYNQIDISNAMFKRLHKQMLETLLTDSEREKLDILEGISVDELIGMLGTIDILESTYKISRYPHTCSECPFYNESTYRDGAYTGKEGHCRLGYFKGVDTREFDSRKPFDNCDIRNNESVVTL